MAFVTRRFNLFNLRNIKNNAISETISRKCVTRHYTKALTTCRFENKIYVRSLQTLNTINKSVAFKLSAIGEDIRDVVLKEWFIKVGERVQQFDKICAVQSDKEAIIIISRYDGIVTKIYYDVDQTALVGQPIVDIEVENTEDNESIKEGTIPKAPREILKKENKGEEKRKILATPTVKLYCKVGLSNVNDSGRNENVLKKDVLCHFSDKSNDHVPREDISGEVPSPVTTGTATMENILEDKKVPITGLTKAMVKSMTDALNIPHLVFSDEYEVTKLVQLRENLKVVAQNRGVKLTYMPFIIKASSLCIKEYPVINSSLDSTCENLIYKASHNIGITMDTPYGLVVPVIKNVQNKRIIDIARELNTLQEKGFKGQIGINDITGGTYTITNVGSIGGTYTKPLIFYPQLAIGALGKIRVLPRFDSEGNVVKAHTLPVSWTADHRVLDGATMARFSNQLRKYLENPYMLLLDI